MSDLPDGVRVERDLAYGADPDHRLDVYRLDGRSGGPLVFFIHGGGWVRGDKANASAIGPVLDHWCRRGYGVVSVNYRRGPGARPAEQAADVARALAFVQCSASAWGLDAQACLVVGHSAGGHLASLLAVDPSVGGDLGLRPWRGTVVMDTAALDVVALMRGPHLPLHDRAWGDDPAVWREGSPLHRLEAGLVSPLLLVCSSRRLRLLRQARDFVQRAREQGSDARMLTVDLSHQDIHAALGQESDLTEAVDQFVRSLGLP